MIAVCVCVCVCARHMNTHRYVPKVEATHAEADKDERAQSCVLSVLCQGRRLSLLFNSVEEGKLDTSHTQKRTRRFRS